jgi:hypothetical protein
MFSDTFPAGYFADAYRGGKAYLAKHTQYDQPYPSFRMVTRLITEAAAGRLLKVTGDGEIVWEYINPERGGEAEEYIPVVSRGRRVDARTLEPGFLEGLQQKESLG